MEIQHLKKGIYNLRLRLTSLAENSVIVIIGILIHFVSSLPVTVRSINAVLERANVLLI